MVQYIKSRTSGRLSHVLCRPSGSSRRRRLPAWPRVLISSWLVLSVSGCGTQMIMRVPDPAVRYIAFGDSTTAGPAERDYPDILRELLGEPVETFANEGKSGESAEEGLVRLDVLLSRRIYPNARVLLYWEGGKAIVEFTEDYDPFLVFSADDPAYPYAEELEEVLTEAQTTIEQAIGSAVDAGLVVYIATYFPLAPDFTECDALPFDIILPSQAQNANSYVMMLNEHIRSAAVNGGATVVDVEASADVLQADPANYFNCNHLSTSGNEVVAHLFYDAID